MTHPENEQFYILWQWYSSYIFLTMEKKLGKKYYFSADSGLTLGQSENANTQIIKILITGMSNSTTQRESNPALSRIFPPAQRIQRKSAINNR